MKLKFAGLLLFLLLFAPYHLSAQGLFEGLGVPKTVTASGHTEVIGFITVSLRQGTTVAGTLVVDVSPLRITNTNASDIAVVFAGSLAAGGAVTIDTDEDQVRIPVLAGAFSGSIRIDGIRVSVAGSGISSLNANLSWDSSLNLFTAGASVPVINGVQTGLVANPITDRFSIFNGQIFDNTSTITVSEGHAPDFTNSTAYGQTVPTRIRISVTDYPENVRMTFPATVTAKNSAATLTTVEGAPVTLPRDLGNTVTYNFAGVTGSDAIVEAFDILFTVSLAGPVGISQPTIEVSLAPIGAAVPGSAFPSTDVPRYAAEYIVVQEGSSRIITKILYWTGIDASASNQVNLLNPSGLAANLTIDAFNSSGQAVSGTGITNPVKLTLTANQALTRSPAELFGTSSGVSSIRIQSTNSDVLASAVVSRGGRTESVPFARTVSGFFAPVVNEAAQLNIMNPNSAAVSGTLSLRTAEGRLVSTVPVTLASLASTSLVLANTFNAPSEGYVFGSFSSPVVAFESFGENTLNMLALQPASAVNALYLPFFAVGNGFDTDINLLNVSEDTVQLRGQLFNGTGQRIGSDVLITMPPSEQLAVPVSRLFSQVPSTGYIRFEVPLFFKGLFGYYPLIAGHARIKSAQGDSTAVPVSAFPLTDSYLLGSGTGAGEFQGISLVNPGTAAVSVTLQAVNPNGLVQSTVSVTLNPGQLSSKLITELFTGGVAPQSVIRITALAPIVATTLVGSNSMDSLRSLPVLR